jgi:predicted DNA-binding transcriptional regulator AlpA
VNQLLFFEDLVQRRLVKTWTTLNRWIDQEGFPPGRLIGRNRVWTEAEVWAWIGPAPPASRSYAEGLSSSSRAKPHDHQPRHAPEHYPAHHAQAFAAGAALSKAAGKRAQRKRRKLGVEQVSAFVHKSKLVSLLIWEGHLDESVYDLPAKERNAKISGALGSYLFRQCWHIGVESDDPPPKYADGSFGREATALRDGASYPANGLIEREGELADSYGLSPPFLITRRTSALRRAVPPDAPAVEWFPDDDVLHLGSDSAWSGSFIKTDRGWQRIGGEFNWPDEEQETPGDEYDPELDVEEESADMAEEAIKGCFDGEGYESE